MSRSIGFRGIGRASGQRNRGRRRQCNKTTRRDSGISSAKRARRFGNINMAIASRTTNQRRHGLSPETFVTAWVAAATGPSAEALRKRPRAEPPALARAARRTPARREWDPWVACFADPSRFLSAAELSGPVARFQSGAEAAFAEEVPPHIPPCPFPLKWPPPRWPAWHSFAARKMDMTHPSRKYGVCKSNNERGGWS